MCILIDQTGFDSLLKIILELCISLIDLFFYSSSLSYLGIVWDVSSYIIDKFVTLWFGWWLVVFKWNVCNVRTSRKRSMSSFASYCHYVSYLSHQSTPNIPTFLTSRP